MKAIIDKNLQGATVHFLSSKTFEQLWGSLHFFLCQGINGYKCTKEECPSMDCRQARVALSGQKIRP